MCGVYDCVFKKHIIYEHVMKPPWPISIHVFPRNLAAGAGAIATGLGLAQGVAAQELGLGLADQESERIVDGGEL